MTFVSKADLSEHFSLTQFFSKVSQQKEIIDTCFLSAYYIRYFLICMIQMYAKVSLDESTEQERDPGNLNIHLQEKISCQGEKDHQFGEIQTTLFAIPCNLCHPRYMFQCCMYLGIDSYPYFKYMLKNIQMQSLPIFPIPSNLCHPRYMFQSCMYLDIDSFPYFTCMLKNIQMQSLEILEIQTKCKCNPQYLFTTSVHTWILTREVVFFKKSSQ